MRPRLWGGRVVGYRFGGVHFWEGGGARRRQFLSLASVRRAPREVDLAAAAKRRAAGLAA
jgi:hypothetical protein